MRHRSVGRLERSNPRVTFDVIADMSRPNRMPGRKCRTSNNELNAFSNDFFVAHTVLNRANRALVVKDVRDLSDRDSGMNRLGRNNAVVATRQLAGISGGIEADGKVFRSGKLEAILPYSVGVLLPHIVSPHFGFASLCEVRGKQAAYGTTTDDANLHLRNTFLLPLGSSEELPRHIRQTLAFCVADSVGVLRVKTHFAVFIDDLRMHRENH